MADEKISIIVPIYKVEEYLDKCVESIVNQTYKNLEIILVDDGSPDNCPKMCDEWAKKDGRIKVVHKKNGGQSSARNMGIDVSTGEYIGFVDGDDYIEQNMYEKLYSAIKKDNCDIALCNYFKVNNENKISVIEKNLDNVNSENICNFFVTHNYKICQDKIITDNIMGSVWRAIYKKEKLVGLRFENFIFEDLIFNVNFINSKIKISVVKDCLYNYVQREGSTLNHISVDKIYFEIKSMEKLVSVLENKVDYELMCSYKFYLYKAIIIKALNLKDKDLLKNLMKNKFLKMLKTKKNYKLHNKYTESFKTKISNFLIYHGMFGLYKLLNK